MRSSWSALLVAAASGAMFLICEPASAELTPDARAALTQMTAQVESLKAQINTDENSNLPKAQQVQLDLSQAVSVSQSADDAKLQASRCQHLSQIQAAFTGGFALNPAPYGKTYIGIAALVAPIFYSGCNTGTGASPSDQTKTLQAQKQSADGDVKAIQDRINLNQRALIAAQAQLLSAYSAQLK